MFSLDRIKQIKMSKVNITKDRKKYYKDYYKKNKERMLEQSKQFYLDNREEINKSRKGTQTEYYKKYYLNNKDKYKARLQTDVSKKKHRLASLKSYYKHHDARKERNRLHYHNTKPPPNKKSPPKPKPPKPARTKNKKLIRQPIKSNHTYDADGFVILRFNIL
jgi:hypothetical protein